METISREKWKVIKLFITKWFTNTIASGKNWNSKKYRQALLEELGNYIPQSYLDGDDDEAYTGYFTLNQIQDWCNSVDIDKDGKSNYCPLLCDYFNYDYEENSYLSKKGQYDFVCAFRIAIDLFVQQSGGVVGYCVQDLLNAFDNDKDALIELGFDKEILDNPNHGIWL